MRLDILAPDTHSITGLTYGHWTYNATVYVGRPNDDSFDLLHTPDRAALFDRPTAAPSRFAFVAEAPAQFKLLHGRETLATRLDDWGFDGPTFLRIVRAEFDGETITLTDEDGAVETLRIIVDCIAYNGAFYGDAEFQPAEGPEDRLADPNADPELLAGPLATGR